MSGLSPENAAVRITPEIEKALESASFEEMKKILHHAEVAQGLRVPDAMNPSVLIPTPLADAAPRRLAKTLTINGQKHFIEGEDEAALLRAENALLSRVLSEPVEHARSETPHDPATGRFTSTVDAVQQAALDAADRDLKFKRGEITTDQWLEESGAIERHLEKRRIYQESWESATQEFLACHVGWRGGTAAVEAMGKAVIELGLDGQPSVAALEAAYTHLLSTNSLPENPQLVLEQKMAEATDFETLKTLAREASGLLGR